MYDKEYKDELNFQGQAYLDIQIRLNFEDMDFLSEYYIYNWISFISEIGGFLGLFLGYAVLTLVDLMEVVFNKFCDKNAEENKQPQKAESTNVEVSKNNLNKRRHRGIKLDDDLTISPVRNFRLSPARVTPANLSPTRLAPNANMSPVRANPANFSPTRRGPKNASPTRQLNLSPVRLAPTNMSPTRASPANFSPTRLIPGSMGQLDVSLTIDMSPTKMSHKSLSPADAASGNQRSSFRRKSS